MNYYLTYNKTPSKDGIKDNLYAYGYNWNDWKDMVYKPCERLEGLCLFEAYFKLFLEKKHK